MRSWRIVTGGAAAAVVLGLCVLGARAGHNHHCDGEWCGYLFDYGGEQQEGDCYSCGEWHATIDTGTGEFNFHFHGETEDSYCFGEHDTIYEYYPQWVADVLQQECGYCIEYAEKTQYSVDHHGDVFLKVKGYAYECSDYDEE